MSIATLVIGPSGTGKTTSLRNLNPADTLVLQAVRKPMPFRGWLHYDKTKAPGGNIFVVDDAAQIIAAMQRTTRDVIVLDDFQFVMANEYMRRSAETGYQKFSDIGKNVWDILNAVNRLADHKRVYVLTHSETTEDGRIKAKTIGKMIDEKLSFEGLFTIVMRSQMRDGEYVFATKNNGVDTTKTPMDLFDADFIANDLARIDEGIRNYYGITTAAKAA